VERIRFTGGEPFLRKDFFKILDSIKNLGFKKITVATNGLLLRKDFDKVNESCITDLGVSIDGLRATNDIIRGINGYFDLVIEGISKIKKKITIMTTVNQKNAYELEELFNICDDQGVMWDFNLLDDHLFFLKGSGVDELWPDKEAVDSIIESIEKNLHRKVLKRISRLQIDYAEKYLRRLPIDEPPCYLGYTDIDIDSGGNLWTGCYVLPPIGNILDAKVGDLIQSEAYEKRLKQMLKRQCPGCSCGYELNVSIEQLPIRAFEYLVGGKRK